MTRRRRRQLAVMGFATAAGAASAVIVVACGARSGLDTPTVYVRESREGGADADAETGPDGSFGFDATTEFDALLLSDAPLLVDAGPLPRALDCAEAGITYIYVIGEDNTLYSFYPTTGEFTPIGVIDCPDPTLGASPFSMAVNHLGVAYVVYSPDGSLFRVSTKTAECEPTGFVPGQHGFGTFGMGFAATPADAGGPGEALYVAGDDNNSLATIDTTTFVLTPIAPFGSFDGIPVLESELTGTGAGGLFGFFDPDPSNAPSYIARFNPATAAVESLVELPDIALGDGWAFGFWGGDFYTFTDPGGFESVVTRYRPSDKSIAQVATAPPGTILVGAGVSTCAPQQ